MGQNMILSRRIFRRYRHTAFLRYSSSPKERFIPPHEEDVKPVLFIQKYKTIIDTERIRDFGEQTEDSSGNETETQRKIRFVLSTLKRSKTFESWQQKLQEKPQPLFSPPPRTEDVKTVFQDEEIITKPSSLNLPATESDLEWTDSSIDIQSLPKYYSMLSKSRLSLMVCITAAAGYGLAPSPFVLSTFLCSTIGTGLMAASANSINQIMEVPFDSQMNRTKNRVLVRGLLTPQHAFGFAIASAVSGTFILSHFVNDIAAGLGLTTLILYTCVYTPMKRISIANTWVGSIVGAIPPLIGWVGCTGTLDYGAAILGGILYAWQFPHFNSLSWNLRQDYARAGYRMMSVINPDLCKRVALRYSVGCIGICSVAPILNVTDITFALDSLPLNLYLVYLSHQFYQKADSSSSRKLFRYTLIHLPLLMTLLFIGKKSIE